jgi:hypothetical protein
MRYSVFIDPTNKETRSPENSVDLTMTAVLTITVHSQKCLMEQFGSFLKSWRIVSNNLLYSVIRSTLLTVRGSDK